MNEIWRDIKGYEGYFQASSMGRVRSLDRYIIRSDGQKEYRRGKILKPTLVNGYHAVSIRGKEGKRVQRKVHRLVMLAFHSLEELMQINHINGIKTDNRVENLEWCTASENCKHAYKTGLRVGLSGDKNPMYNKKPFFYGKGKEHHPCFGRTGKLHPLYGKTGAECSSSKVVLNTETGIYYESTKEASKYQNLKLSAFYYQLRSAKKNKTSFIVV